MGLIWSGLMSLPEPKPDSDDAALTGMAAASAAEAAGLQGKYKEMADLLYTNQPSWARLGAADRDEDDEDPVMAFLGASSENQKKRPSSEAAPRGDWYDSDNDLEHAQVVVLKEGKHLSKDEYMDQRTQEDEAPPGRLC